MGVSVRYFVVEDGTERLVRVPLARWRRWVDGDELARHYAGRSIRILSVDCGIEDGRVMALGDIRPFRVWFLADGRLDRERHLRNQVAKLNVSPPFDGGPRRPLDVMPHIRRRRLDERTAFKVTAAHVRALHEALAGQA